ncbi:MAG: hypothetical protein CMG36_02910 [Candidatus Marinimicrobia bacterium]|jgi:hypothetical protein|nr:hypothetical protein [Candidatus Neomarinimicrobiota bacterium]MCH1563320.1 NAD-glutamate dehydrogenase [Paracoccaceae bacterium]|tara:strand:- start:1491 stop:1733 length:243 start_codon:yes stop_codon:yes gene_type:complete
MKNLGETKLKKRRSKSDSMKDFDKLPKLLRDWLNGAALPWRPKSVVRAYNRFLRQTNDAGMALKKLEELQQQKLSIDQKI